MVTRGDVFGAAAAGERAYETGLGSAACPYDPKVSPFLARAWIRGHLVAGDAANRAAGCYTFAERALIEELGDPEYLLSAGLIDRQIPTPADDEALA